MWKPTIIKIFLGTIGAVYIFFGISALISNLVYIISGYPVFKVIFPIKILTIAYYIYLCYLAILGFYIYFENKWTIKGIIVAPVLFIFFEYFSEPRLNYFILLLSVFVISALFLNIKTVKIYLEEVAQQRRSKIKGHNTNYLA